jgi:pimeloyl-ACP methyl ester carboxylesterase
MVDDKRVSYKAATAAIVQEAADQARKTPLRNPLCAPIFLFHPQPTAKVCLFFHGFTAAPYQFGPIAKVLYQAGYNVVVPLMPGHGLAGNWGPELPPPLPQDGTVYQEFARSWLKRVGVLGKTIAIGGLSGGGTLAAWLAQDQPMLISKTLLFAPYLSGSNLVLDMFTRMTKGYQGWIIPPGVTPPGYPGFMVPALRVFLEMGKQVLDRASTVKAASMFVISSESDRAVNNMDHRVLFERTLVHQPRCWYLCFDRVQDIPHTMMTQAEGNVHEQLLVQLAKAYVEADLSWAELRLIALRMGRGESCAVAVKVLLLDKRGAPGLPTLMTMLDVRQFVVDEVG